MTRRHEKPLPRTNPSGRGRPTTRRVPMEDDKHRAEVWALASDDNLRDLLVWRRVKARAEAGGFNGVLIHDYHAADDALDGLVKLGGADMVAER